MNIPRVRDWMSDAVTKLRDDTDMMTAVDMLLGSKALAVPVIDADKNLVGILTDKDCLRTVSGWVHEQAAGGRVRDYMSSVKVWLAPESDLLQVAGTFLKTHFVQLPVIAEGKLVGTLHRGDVARGLVDWQRAHDNELSQGREAARSGERPQSIEAMQRVVATHTKAQVVSRFKKARK